MRAVLHTVALRLLVDGLLGDAIAQGQHTGRFIAGGELGAHRRCGASVVVQRNLHHRLPVDCGDCTSSRSASRAMNRGKRLLSMQLSGMRHISKMKKSFKLKHFLIILLLKSNAFAQNCAVNINVQPVADGLVIVSVDNISSRDVYIPYDFLPWSIFGFGVNFSASYRETRTEIRPIYGFGHSSEVIVLNANSSMQQEVSLYKRFHDLKSDAGIVDVAWVYRFAESGKGADGCALFKGNFSIFETPIKQTSE